MRFANFLKDQKVIEPQKFIAEPQVSVVMPTYCRAHDGLLARAIETVLSQTFTAFEFIIVDDGSIDGSEDVVREFQRHDDRILYVRHQVNSGLPGLRTDEGILLSRGQYVAIQTDDDEWLRPFLETVLREAVAKDKPFVHCQAEWFLEDRLYRPRFPVRQPTYASLLQANKIANNSTLLHRSILREVGLYDPHVILRRITDWDLWLRVAREVAPCMLPEVLVREYGGLPDSIGVRAPHIEYEDFALLALQLSRNNGLRPGSIQDYDVLSLSRYSGVLPHGAIVSLHRNMVRPWLGQHEEQLISLGVPLEDITRLKQEIAACSVGTEKTILPKKNLWPSIARVGRPISNPARPFISARRLAPVLGRFLCSIPALCKTLIRAQHDAYDSLSPDFQGIKDDALMLSHRKRGFVLRKSCNLQDVPLIPYKVDVRGDGLCAILLALVPEEPKARGTVAVAAVSQSARLEGYAMMPMSLIHREKPTEFFFEPPLGAGKYYVVVLGKNLDSPVHVLEFAKRHLIRRLFCRLTPNEQEG